MKTLALILALAPGLASAQSLAERLANAPEISFEEWKSMTARRTVIYQVNGQNFGFERYRGANKVTIQLEDGTCIDGEWYMEQTAFCFDWQDGPLNCFHHKRLDDAIYIIGLSEGEETADIQLVARIDSTPLSCRPRLLSLLTPEPTP